MGCGFAAKLVLVVTGLVSCRVFAFSFLLGSCRNSAQTRLCLLLSNPQELPSELCSCEALMHLDVSKNRLLALPESFSALSHITQLSLTGAALG
jgi:Leucine-rich repeat (LRR) protein